MIHVPPPLNPETVQVGYFLTGDFGGVGGFRVETGEQEIAIRLDQTSKPAKTLKALLYAPGCEIVLLRVDDLKVGDRDAQFVCRPLPTVDIAAGFPRPASLNAYELEVEVTYVASWSHNFFGIADGMVQTFRIATVPAARDGSFRFQLPDFSKDPLYSSAEKRASLSFYVRERRSGNVVGQLKGNEEIQGDYPRQATFAFVPWR